MFSKELLKEIIISNKEFIINQVKEIIDREGIFLPPFTNSLSASENNEYSFRKVVILYGVRRSGKTYILYQLFKKYKNRALYVDFEDERLADFEVKDFEILQEAFLELNPHLIGYEEEDDARLKNQGHKNPGELVFLLDEIQNIKGWENYCRRITERGHVNVFVTGSSSKMMPLEIHTSLRGRSWSIEVTPFSFREYLQLKGVNTDDRHLVYGSKKSFVKSLFSEYLKWGGFPEVLLLKTDFEKRKVTKEYLEAMFFKDLVERFNISNISLLNILMEKLFSSFTLKFSLTAFYKQYKDKLPFSKDTLFSYYHYFLESMYIFETRKFTESTYKRMRNPAKIYLIDTGICRKVTSEDWGRILENVIFCQLRRQSEEVFYFEEKSECDFIIKDEEGLFSPCQVTWELNDQNKEREIKGLLNACQRLKAKRGILFTSDEEGSENIEGINIDIMPAWKWLLKEEQINRLD